MERLKQRLESASRAYDTLRAVAALDLPDRERRDVAIMRFIYTFEAVWKLAQAYLREHEGIEAASPKSCVRSSFDLALLSAEDTESALVMADDRNLAVHIYIELLAEAIRSRMSGHVAVLGTWLDAIRERMPSRSASAADA